MSTIYSLPLTNILVNGTKTYRIRTRDYDDVLEHVVVASKTNETINLDFTDLYFQDIAFASNSDLGEVTLKCVRETKDVKNYHLVDSRPITCSDELKDEYLPELQFLVSRGYLIDIPQPIFKDITLDLNNAWRRCQTYDSPLEGWTLYESASNWHVSYGYAYCYLNIVSNDAPLVIYYCSYAEAQFDWLKIEFPDGTMVDTLRIPQQPPTSLSRMSIVEKDATMTGLCTIAYFKDSSGDSGDDRAYILLPNDIPFINEYEEQPPVPEPIHIQNITISGPNQITEPGTYDYYATISPANADEYDIDWDTIGFTDPHWYLQTDPEDPFHAQIVIPETESFGSAFYLRCEDNVSFNYDRFSISIDIYIEPPVPEPEPLCLTSNSSQECSFSLFSTAAFENLQYKLNDGDWTPLNTKDPITVPSHAKLYLKADRYYGWKVGFYFDYPLFVDWSPSGVDNTFDVSGELISIDSGTTSNHCFSQLFHSGGHINIKNAKDLVLYNENTGDNAFYGMFRGNSHLITTPTLINSRSLNGCASMFRYCAALTSVELQHTYIGRNELNSMFANCTSLNDVSLPNLTTWDSAQTGSWLYDVSPTGTFRCKPELLDTIPSSSSGIPSGWTVVEY